MNKKVFLSLAIGFGVLLISGVYFFLNYNIDIVGGRIYIQPHYYLTMKDTVFDEKEKNSNLIFVITNQSFEKQNVRIKVKIDGKLTVNENFYVENQHNWLFFYQDLTAGKHKIEALSEDGSKIEKEILIENGKKKWILFSYTGGLNYNESEKPFLLL